MASEKIPCPVEGCDEVFDDETAAAAHMKEKHLDVFSAQVPAEQELDEGALALVPPGVLELLDKRVETKIKAALEAERSQIVAAVKGTISQVLADARAAGLSVPGVPSGPREGGAIPGSPVTPEGLAWINLLRGGGGGDDSESLDSFIRKAGQFKAIAELFNPPASITERIMQTAYIRSLKNVGLVTDKQMADVEKSLLGEDV